MLEQDRTAACNRKAHLIERKPERGLHRLVIFFLLGLVNDRDHQMVDVDLQLVERLEPRCVVGFLREIEKPRLVLVLRHVMPDAALSQRIGPAVIGIAIGKWCVATEGAVTDAQEPRPD